MSPASETPTPLEFPTPQEEPGCMLSQATSSNSNPETILSKVEAVIESVIDSMLHKEPELAIAIRVKKKQTQQTQARRSVVGGMRDEGTDVTGKRAGAEVGWTRVLVRFPGRDERESWRFS